MNEADSTEWHIEQNGGRQGPLAPDKLQELLEAGALTRDTLVWRPGLRDWQPAGTTELETLFGNEPPPLRSAAIPNGLVWTLAFAPLIGEFFSQVLFEIFASPQQRALDRLGHDVGPYFWWVTLVLNIGLSLLDERRLKKAGVDTTKLGWAWLVPVYLYKRATVLKQNLAYFFIWIVCFLAAPFVI